MNTNLPLASFATFGDLLKHLRRRARLTPKELSIEMGYSEAQISRLEQNLRLPDPATVARLLEQAAQARGEPPPVGRLTIARTVAQEITQQVEEPTPPATCG